MSQLGTKRYLKKRTINKQLLILTVNIFYYNSNNTNQKQKETAAAAVVIIVLEIDNFHRCNKNVGTEVKRMKYS